MDYIFSPWRYRYVAAARTAPEKCVLCGKLRENRDAANLILHRGRHNAVLLNLFPYTSGHMMILPREHVARLSDADAETRTELMELAARCERALDAEYRPEGMNLGVNLGAVAGAGIAGHLHLHLVPRWTADSNFMTVVGETRVLPEELSRTYERLLPYFAAAE